MPPASPRIRLVVPGNVRHNSGGNVYNAALARELDGPRCRGGNLPARRRLAGRQRGGPAAPGHAAARGARRRPRRGGGPATAGAATWGTVTVVDSLLACGAPEELEAAAAAGGPGLDPAAHAPAGPPGARTQGPAGGCRRHLHERFGRGGHPRPPRPRRPPGGPARDRPRAARGRQPVGRPPHLIAVAALLPNKDQSLLLAALARLADVPWTASLIGSDTADPAYAAQLRTSVERLGLAGRVRIPGELRGPALDAEWDAADLSLLISRAETYGLVVTESLARGIPVVVRERHRRRRGARRRHPARAAGGLRRRTVRPAHRCPGCRAPPSASERTPRRWRTCSAAGWPTPGSGPAGGRRQRPPGAGCPAGTPPPGPCWSSCRRNRGTDSPGRTEPRNRRNGPPETSRRGLIRLLDTAAEKLLENEPMSPSPVPRSRRR